MIELKDNDNKILNTNFIVKIDADFNKEEVKLIKKAFSEWSKNSDNKLKFKIILNVQKPGLFYKYKNNQKDVFIWKLDRRDLQIDKELRDICKTCIGYYIGRNENAHLILFTNQTINSFYKTSLHEIGHLIGLDDTDNKNTIMHVSPDSSCITLIDSENMCKIYGCKPNSTCN